MLQDKAQTAVILWDRGELHMWEGQRWDGQDTPSAMFMGDFYAGVSLYKPLVLGEATTSTQAGKDRL